jgi:hypothetical protein
MADEYDSPWKEILDLYFRQFLAFFFPDIEADVDWSRGYESLDKELPQLEREGETGRRYADKLMKVWRKNGEERLVFIHTEVQGTPDPGFPERMYIYNYRIFDRRRQPVVSLAVLADERPSWRPDRHVEELWGCRAGLWFPIIKLWDYNERWSELEASDNPFATVVIAHLKTKATRDDDEERYRWKVYLSRRLYERSYERRDVIALFRFIDWLLVLPDDLAKRFRIEQEQIETEKNMRYVTSVERLAKEEGHEEGLLRGQILVLKRLLKRRFRQLPSWVEERLGKASREELESWAERVLDAESLDEVFAAG